MMRTIQTKSAMTEVLNPSCMPPLLIFAPLCCRPHLLVHDMAARPGRRVRLFAIHGLRRSCRLGRGIGNRECQPEIPALGAVLGRKLLVALQVQIALLVTERKNVTDLGPEARDARAEAAERSRRAEIVGDLLEVIANEAELPLPGD